MAPASLRQTPPPGQGYYFAFSVEDKQLLHPWKPIDQIEAV
jgi:hypothetical protein